MTMAARTQTMVQLTDELIEALDARASREGVSRSHLIRRAIEELLAADRSAAIDRRIVEGYTRMPQGGRFDADEWGDVDRLMQALTAEQTRQQAAEDRQAERGPW